jgi:hypothetical protein
VIYFEKTMMKFLPVLIVAAFFAANAFAFVCPDGEIPPGFQVETCGDENSEGCVRGESDGLLVAWEHAEGSGPILKWGNLAHKCDYDFKLLEIYEEDSDGDLISGSVTDLSEFDWTICKPSTNGLVLTVDIYGELEAEAEGENEGEASEEDGDMDIEIEIVVAKTPQTYFFDWSFELDDYCYSTGEAEDIVLAAIFSCEDDEPGNGNDHRADCPLDEDLIVCSELALYTYIPSECTTEVTVEVAVRHSDEENGQAGFFLIFDTGDYEGKFVRLQYQIRFEVPKHSN